MARWEGLEPPTTWFVARDSIQLSYQRGEVRIIKMRHSQVNFNLTIKLLYFTECSYKVKNYLLSVKNV